MCDSECMFVKMFCFFRAGCPWLVQRIQEYGSQRGRNNSAVHSVCLPKQITHLLCLSLVTFSFRQLWSTSYKIYWNQFQEFVLKTITGLFEHCEVNYFWWAAGILRLSTLLIKDILISLGLYWGWKYWFTVFFPSLSSHSIPCEDALPPIRITSD